MPWLGLACLLGLRRFFFRFALLIFVSRHASLFVCSTLLFISFTPLRFQRVMRAAFLFGGGAAKARATALRGSLVSTLLFISVGKFFVLVLVFCQAGIRRSLREGRGARERKQWLAGRWQQRCGSLLIDGGVLAWATGAA